MMMNDKDYPPNAGQEEELTLAEDDIHDNEDAEDAFETERAELNDKILRLAAELENTRRRAERDKADAGRYAIANFARDLLGVADNFERALQTVGENSEDQATTKEALTGLLAGLRMTEKELLTVLERHGVRRVAAAGEKFDPNLHQAVAQAPSQTIPSGHVVDVVQSGFTIGERVLRAAIVTVSTGPAKTGHGDDAASGGRVDTEA